MDPERRARLHGTFGASAHQDTFVAPARSAYSSPRQNPPYADSAHKAFAFDSNLRLLSEQRAQYAWPSFVSQAPVIRYKSEMVLE